MDGLHHADAGEQHQTAILSRLGDAMRHSLHLAHIVLGLRDNSGEVGDRLLER
jgi:hypothetical protein